MMRAVPLAHSVLMKPCDADLLEHAIDRSIALQVSLGGAFDRGLQAIWVAWQPILRVLDQSLYAHEALMRSREPSLANPLALLAAAEHLGRLDDLGAIVRDLAAAPTATTRRFVNLHPRDLGDESLYDPGSPLAVIASRVVLEITERASLDVVPDLADRLTRLRSLGYRIALDDVGQGYSGLSTFARFSPDIAKVDMSLVRGVDQNRLKLRIVRSIVELCHDLGIDVVGEGVETREERDTLVEAGCDFLQGYLFARPGPAFPEWTWGESILAA